MRDYKYKLGDKVVVHFDGMRDVGTVGSVSIDVKYDTAVCEIVGPQFVCKLNNPAVSKGDKQ
ncbi:MAG: hypothetical protein ABJ195_13875 [Marinomonas sp.]|uniref:hypothetical protein n=1 Tax=Sphingomonadales TaxID=204457 RepID=UPI0032665A84